MPQWYMLTVNAKPHTNIQLIANLNRCQCMHRCCRNRYIVVFYANLWERARKKEKVAQMYDEESYGSAREIELREHVRDSSLDGRQWSARTPCVSTAITAIWKLDTSQRLSCPRSQHAHVKLRTKRRRLIELHAGAPCPDVVSRVAVGHRSG